MVQNNNEDSSLIGHFSIIKDPRIERAKRHKLIDILGIAICGTICGADGWVEIESFGKAKEKWLKSFLELPYGIPSHDTFGRVFALIDPDEFRNSFIKWVRALVDKTKGKLIAIDGKTARRSHNMQEGKKALHMVSAWAVENSVVLGQVKTEEKSNEITAIPELLKLLEIKGCIITIDAMGCQTAIAKDIINKKGDYILALKGNQRTLHEDVKLYLDDAIENKFKEIEHSFYKTLEKDHGRIEERKYWITEQIGWLDQKAQWAGMRSIGVVEATRMIGEKKTIERRYYISSIESKGKEFAEAVRGHWAIENSMHWILDIAFREDESRVRKGNSAENLAMMRHIALNLLKSDKTTKCGIKGKRLKAGWDNDYLISLLTKV